MAGWLSADQDVERRIPFLAGDVALTPGEWQVAFAELSAMYERWVPGNDPFTLTPAMTQVARLDITGDGVNELLVTPFSGACRVAYCFTAIFERKADAGRTCGASASVGTPMVCRTWCSGTEGRASGRCFAR